ncbi:MULTISPECIES: endonuclease V [Niastella]|uniref:Endonuclease V n=1 Tax=Niastella soli TaxID=2821487 RepID=A0ABS3Z5J4_9BACT|nr:endonuclease V [Niastella soli]MBO9205413.1 endonuclease V [Niastella soli]
MILAIDVHYKENTAKAVGALFQNWGDAVAQQHILKYIKEVAEYEPGSFYKRELPCILEIFKDVDLSTISYIVIDGFVVLDDAGKPGLGAYVYESIQQQVPVIGVAKTGFHQNQQQVIPVLRGTSDRPLYVTSVGIELPQAAEFVKSMHGEFRLPTVLKELDRITKEP